MRSPFFGVLERQAPVTGVFGYEVPTFFRDPAREVRAALEGAGMTDASYRSRLRLSGPDGIDLLHRISSNDLLHLEAGRAQATVLTTEKGRIVDLLLVAKRGEDCLLVGSGGSEEEVIRWVDKYTITENLALEPLTARTFMITLLGPGAEAAARSAVGDGAGGTGASWPGGVDIFREGGDLPRVHLTGPVESAGAVWRGLRGAGVEEVGYHAWELLRIMHGIPERPGELNEAFNPYAVGLRDAISFTKGCYIGQEVIARLDTYQKVRWGLSGLVSRSDRFAPGTAILDAEGREIGSITSRAPVPLEGWWPALAVIRLDAVTEKLDVTTPDRSGVATLERLPMHIPPTASE